MKLILRQPSQHARHNVYVAPGAVVAVVAAIDVAAVHPMLMLRCGRAYCYDFYGRSALCFAFDASH